jgi:chromate transporter
MDSYLSTASRLRELAWIFLRLGLTAFGGPAAHIALMRNEFVQRRKWLSDERFLDLLGATNLIPGPNSTEMAIHIGYLRVGWPGLIVAGSAFIFPAMLLTLAFGWVYVQYGALPQVGWLLYGVKPVILAIVIQALWGLGRMALRDAPTILAALAAAALSFTNANLILLLVLGGLGVAFTRRLFRPQQVLLLFPPLLNLAIAAQPYSLGVLFATFLKIGSVLYGSGYVLLAFLEAEFVKNLGWLTQQQLLDAVAVGQVTPGPVFTTATFIGYLLGGVPGGLAATVGIFLPAFLFVALSNPLIPRLRKSPWTAPILDGVNAASLGLMAAVTLQLGRAAFVDLSTLLVGVAAVVLLLRFKVNATWLILGGALLGWFLWLGW